MTGLTAGTPWRAGTTEATSAVSDPGEAVVSEPRRARHQPSRWKATRHRPAATTRPVPAMPPGAQGTRQAPEYPEAVGPQADPRARPEAMARRTLDRADRGHGSSA